MDSARIKWKRKKGAGATPDYNLKITHPQYATMWHPTLNKDASGNPLTPEMVTSGSHKKVWWLCDKGHVFQRLIKDLISRRGKCPFCAGRKLAKDNSIAALYPNVAATWHPTRNGSLSPHAVRPGSRNGYWWLCERGHESPASPYARTKLNTGCPECAGRKVGKDNNLAYLYPQVAATLHPTKNLGVRADQIHARSQDKFIWLCEKGHEWPAIVYNRTVNGSGCPKCNPMTSRLGVCRTRN